MFAGDGGDQVGPTVTPPAGWAVASGSPHSLVMASDTGYGSHLWVFWKIASGESGSYVFTHTAADSQAIMYRITGADTTAPLTPAGTTNTNYNDTPGGVGKQATALGLTTANNDSLVIYAVALWDGGPGTAPSGSTPTFTERLDTGALYIADGVLATAGATGNKVNASNFTAQNAASVWRALLVAVQAPGAGRPVKVWNGSSWVTKPVKVWSGSAWVAKPVKVWNGSAWA
jgi:hypothetical protein